MNEDGSVLPEHQLGELRIRGAVMMHGYVANPEANRECRDADGWFRTGDLAFVHNGEVVIAGRKKDQIIVRGVNYLAHEIENVVERVDGVRVTFSAAVGVREPGGESDQIVIFFTPERWEAAALTATAEAVRAILVREVGLAPDLLVPVTETEFPKTGSGKIQRAALVAGLRAGKFDGRAIESGQAAPPASRLCRRQWVAAPVASLSAPARRAAGVRLVLAEPGELEYLGTGPDVVTARRGDGFGQEAPGRFRLTVSDREQVHRLLSAVTADHGEITAIAFALPLSGGADPLARLTVLTAEFCSLVSALATGEFGRPRLLVLSAGSVHVRDGDRVDLGTCALPGLVRTAITEVAPLPVQQLDLPADRGDWARAVAAEVDCGWGTGIAAVRKGARLEPRLCPVEEDEAPAAAAPVTVGGLYLVTGGLGGIAREITSYLMASYGVRLLLVGRSPADGERAGRLAELAALGEVAYQQLDVADGDALAAAVSAAEARWGRPLDGVLHLAGADPAGQWASLEQHTIASESPATFAAQYRAKVAGTLALAALLRDRPQASLILFGSVNGEFGGHSFGAYSAASSFLAGFAEWWHHEQHRQVHCLAWSRWAGVGMNRGQPAEPSERRGFATIEPDDGLRLFLSAVATPGPYLLIGLDLANPAIVAELIADRLRVSEVVVAYTAGGAEPAAVRTAAEPATLRCPVPVRLVQVPRIPTGVAGAVDAGQLLMDTAAGRRRRAFTAPATDLERRIALIWSDALNRPSIGRDDSFFELGGNSLRATRLLAMVSDRLAVRVGTQELYENPTVAGMAATITRSEPATS